MIPNKCSNKYKGCKNEKFMHLCYCNIEYPILYILTTHKNKHVEKQWTKVHKCKFIQQNGEACANYTLKPYDKNICFCCKNINYDKNDSEYQNYKYSNEFIKYFIADYMEDVCSVVKLMSETLNDGLKQIHFEEYRKKHSIEFRKNNFKDYISFIKHFNLKMDKDILLSSIIIEFAVTNRMLEFILLKNNTIVSILPPDILWLISQFIEKRLAVDRKQFTLLLSRIDLGY